MKGLTILICMVALTIAAASDALAATKTVSATGDFATLQAAVDNLETWGDGNDTIILGVDVTIVTDTLNLPTKNGGAVTLINAAGTSPVLAADPVTLPQRILRPVNNGMHTIQGITLLGPAGTSGVRTAFKCEAATATDNIEILIKNCVVTRNDGQNRPVTNWGSEVNHQLTGVCNRSLQHGGEAFGGKLRVTVEGCTFAFARGVTGPDAAVYGNIEFGASPKRAGAPDDCFRELNIINSMVMMGRVQALAGRDIFGETTINIKESLFAKHLGRGMRFFKNDFGIGFNMVIQDSIVAQNMNESQIAFATGFAGNLVLERVTLANAPNSSLIGVFSEDHAEGVADYSFTDVIFDSTGNSFRIYPNGTNPHSFSVLNCFARTVNGDNGSMIKDAFAALYGGTGPLMDEPQYVKTDLSELDGKVGWYRATNTIYDVANDAFLGKGTANGRPQNALAGGADHAHAVEVLNRVDGWQILE